MPRYYFHLHNGLGFVEDEEGQELASENEARRKAVEGVRSIVSDEAKEGFIDLTGKLEVADAGGRPLFTLLFKDAVEVTLPEADAP